ncbi:MAG: helicase-exonuclease AddAB subunit AddA, partial [Ruminococcaceae bacterium]|nr:helicase-exonuclease AddAB subunit AddA [Oscillospiraceae bacterium]
PERWLSQQLEAYTAVCPAEKTRWMQAISREMALTLDCCTVWAQRALQLSQRDELINYQDSLRTDCLALERLQQEAANGTYDTIRQRLEAFSLTPLGAARGVKGTAAEWNQSAIQELRKRINAEMEKLCRLVSGTEEQYRDDLQAMAPLVEALGELVTRFARDFTERKRQKKLLDYNDLEHECLRLLLDTATGEPTPLARELSQRYHQIMVDEYQDTNAAQDALFRALSRQEQNLFMVGDVKQSIYGFRQAMPAIFTDRRDAYPAYDPQAPAYPATVTLEHNFRSRSTVTDAVNFLFRQTMQRELGGVEYNHREQLTYAANYPEAPHTQTEWLLLDGALTEESVDEELAEIHAIARRIRELMATMTVTQGDGQRPLRYGDICILLRGHAKAALFARELNRLGIPTGADSTDRFLSTPEVMTVLSLLRVIDNPLREVEMAAVMLSPLYGFTPDEVAALRLAAGRRTPLYTAMQRQASRQDGTGLTVRCDRLLTHLRQARTLAVSLPADRLLERLYRDTGITAVFSARSGGRQRVANLHQLDRIARSFEQGEFRGLSAFIRHIDRLEEKGKDLPAGSAVSADSVRIMTVHHSKGLEFPVVFLAHLHGRGSNMDEQSRLLFHQEAGIGLRRQDEATLEKHHTLPYAGVLSARRQNDRAEELRVWYVALTRAREKLILVAYHKDMRRWLGKLELRLPPEGRLMPSLLLRANAPAEWLLMASLRHPSFAALRQDPSYTQTLSAEETMTVQLLDPSLSAEEAEETPAETAPVDPALYHSLRERLAYQYPYRALTGVPAKLAASALSHQALSREHVAAARPAFLQKNGLTAAQKGTALHTFMQLADYPAAAADPAAEAARLTALGLLTPAQTDCLPLDKIAGFFASALYARMAASPDCRREFDFTVRVPAHRVDPTLPPTDETVVVQGIADCVFRDGDGLTLVDYKTDRVKEPEELVARYRSQLDFYKQALEPILGLPVTRMVLYSFHLQREIEL